MKHKSIRNRIISIILSIVMVVGAVPLPQFTMVAQAATDTYTSLIPAADDDETALENKQVYFNGIPWYIIEDNSTSDTEGSVTLLAADTSFGCSVFNGQPVGFEYYNSTVKGYLESVIAGTAGEDKPNFKNVADAIEDTVNGKLYLLSIDEARSLPVNVRRIDFTEGDCITDHEWWLRSYYNPGNGEVSRYVYYVNGVDGSIIDNINTLNARKSYGVRPALQLDLSKVVPEVATLPRKTKPEASFTATGPDSGTLSGVESGMKYRINNGVTWTDITGNAAINLTGLSACTITIVRKGDGESTSDSVAQTITVSKAATPSLTATQPSVPGGTGSIPTTTSHQLSTDGTIWTDCAGASTGLPAGTYYVRVKASGTTLASDAQSIEILNPRVTTPTATFTATGPDSGTLSGVESGMKYSLNDGETWTDIIDNAAINLTGLSACTITIVGKGDGQTTSDSEAQTITVEKAETPNLTATQPTTAGEKGSIPTTTAHQLSTDGTIWTDCAGASTGLSAGTYYVRVKASEMTLASDVQSIWIGLKEPAPTASFAATGADSGTLSGVESGMKYSLNDGETWTDITGNAAINLTGLSACTITIVKKGDGQSTSDSEAQTITVEKAETPNLTATQPAAVGSTGSIPTTTSHQKSTNGETWTDCDGEWTGLSTGTYYVRVKASQTTLASDAQRISIVDPWAGEMAVNDDIVIDGEVSLVGDTILNVAEGKSLTVNGTIHGSGQILTIDGSGTVIVSGSRYQSGIEGDVTLNGGELIVAGANGSDSGYGAIGGHGIQGNVTLNGGRLKATAGRGGIGREGFYGNGNQYEPGTSGDSGGSGGTGICGTVILNGGSLVAIGGEGGTGGTGGKGARGRENAMRGTDGGDGGSGGSGGTGISGEVILNGGSLEAVGGSGGSGGTGGAGGEGYFTGTDAGDGGDGGSGGSGGVGGTGISGGVTLNGGTMKVAASAAGPRGNGGNGGDGGGKNSTASIGHAEGSQGSSGKKGGNGSKGNAFGSSVTVSDGWDYYADSNIITGTYYETSVANSGFTNKTVGPGGHRFAYEAVGDTITATCTEEACLLNDSKATLTIVAPVILGYDGTEKPATLSGDTSVLGTPTITYTKNHATYTGIPKDAGTYTASITLGTGNRAATASVEFTIAPKTVTVTGVTATTRDYDSGNLTVELTGGTVNDVESGDAVTVDLSNATGTMADANAGTDKPVTVTGVKLGGADAGNYTLSAQPTGVKVTINKIAYTGTRTATATVRSGQVTTNATLALPELPEGATYASAGTAGGTTPELISGTPSISNGILTFSTTSREDQTSATITITVANATNYNEYNVVVTVTAKAKEEAGVTITGGNKTVTYSVADFTLAKTVADAGTGTGVWTWTSSEASVAVIGEHTGTVTVKKAGTTTIKAVYESETTFGEAEITLTVDRKPLGISWSNTSFTYDGTSHVPTATLSGVKSGDACTVSVSGAQTNAGTGYTATATLDGDAKDNYTLPADKKTCSFSIGKANISRATVTLGTALTYNGYEQTQSVSKVELSGKTIPSSAYTVTGNKGTNAGSYTLTVTAKESSNYTGSVTKAFTIAKKAITPTVTISGTYRFTGSAITPTYTVKDGATTLAETQYSVSLADNVNAGTAKLTVTAAANGNYSFDPATKEFTIKKAAAQSLTDIRKEQGYSAKTLSASVDGLMPENAGALTYTAGAAKITKVSGSTTKLSGFAVDESGKVSAAIADGTAGDVITLPVKIGSVNYEDSSVNVVVTLLDKTEAGASFTEGTSLTKTYGDAAFTLHGKVTEAGTGSGTWTYESGDSSVATVAADATVTITGAGSTTITAVYESESTYGEATLLLTVEKKAVTIKGVVVAEKEYDGTTRATITNEGTVDGAVSGDDVKAVAGTAVFADKNAGNKAVTFEGFTLGGTKAINYTLTAQPLSITGTILPKALTASVTAVDRVYEKGNVNVTLTEGSISGVLDGEEVSADFSAVTAVMADANAGSNKPVSVNGVTITGADAENYSITQPAGVTVNILKADYSGISEITRTFLYTEETKDSVELAAFLLEDCGTFTFMSPVTEGALSYKEAPALSGAVLSYTLNKADAGKSGSIAVTAVMQNYKDFVLTVNVRQIALALYEKNGKAYEARPSKLLNAGKSFTLVPMFADGTVLNERVVWASTEPDAATVSQDGKVTGRANGSTLISVQSEEDPTLVAYCTVEVTEAVTAVNVDKGKLNLGTGESATVTAQVLPFTAQQKLNWSADNGNVKLEESEDTLSVTITGVSAGNAKVTAEAADGSGRKAVVNVSVGNPVPEFTISGKGNATEVQAGKSLAMQLSWKGDKPKNTNVSWSLSSADGSDVSYIASIDTKGMLSGIMAGKVTVTAVSVSDSEKSASAEITVKAAAQSGPEITAISFTNADKLSKGLAAGKSVSLKTKLTLSGEGKAAADAIAWISSDSSIASVSQKGVVKALAPGEVTITALPRKAADISSAPKAEVTFTVSAAVKSIKIDRKKMTLGTQEGSEIGKISIVSVLPANASDPTIEWSADNANVQLAAIPAGSYASEGDFAEAGKAVTTKDGEALAVRALVPGVTKLTGVTTDGSKKKVTCTVNIRGQVTGLSLQTAAAKNGLNDVTKADDEATAAIEYSSNIKAGGSMKLKALVDINGISDAATDADAKKLYKQYKKYTDVSVSYRSSDTSVLTVNKNGKISVNKNASGKTATVYVQSADGKYTAQITVTVK